MAITVDMIDAVKVQFLQPIFEDDFPERGMKAWLTKIEWDSGQLCYKLYFDFTEFEAENDKYFTESYYRTRKSVEITGVEKQLYTAKEAGMYTPKYSVYFSATGDDNRNDAQLTTKIADYLKEVDNKHYR